MFLVNPSCTADFAACLRTKEIIAALIGAGAALIAGCMAILAVYIPELKKKPQSVAVHLEAIAKALTDMADEFRRSQIPSQPGHRLVGNMANYEKKLTQLMGQAFVGKLKKVRDDARNIDNDILISVKRPGNAERWIREALRIAGDLQAKADVLGDSLSKSA